MKRLKNRIGLVTAVACLAFSTVACGSEDANSDQSDSANSSEPNNSSDATLEVPTEKLTGALVDTFPEEVPLYDRTIDESSSSMGEITELPEWGAVLTTSDSFETVDASIREAYSSNGWKIAGDMEANGGYLLTGQHAKYRVSITYTQAFGPDTYITYGVSAKN